MRAYRLDAGDVVLIFQQRSERVGNRLRIKRQPVEFGDAIDLDAIRPLVRQRQAGRSGRMRWPGAWAAMPSPCF